MQSSNDLNMSHYAFLAIKFICAWYWLYTSTYRRIFRDMKLYWYAKNTPDILYLHNNGYLSPETNNTFSDATRNIDASNTAEFKAWLWDTPTEPYLYIIKRNTHHSKVHIQLDCSPSKRTWKINLPTYRKGYDKFETTCGKLLARRIQICLVLFVWSTLGLIL